MTFYLDETRLSILSTAVQNEERGGYFSLLASWGDPYAQLALEVVNSASISGRIANVYMSEHSLLLGKVVDTDSAQAVGVSIIQRDFESRINNINEGKNGLLDNREVEAYHKLAFEDNNIVVDCWTAYDPLLAAENNWQALAAIVPFVTDSESARIHIWNKMIDGSLKTSIATGISTLLTQFFETYSPDWFLSLTQYSADETGYVLGGSGTPFPPDVGGLFGDSFVIDNDITGNLLGTAYSVNTGGGDDSIAGSDFGDNLSGGAHNDLITGNDGNDTLKGDDGEDEVHGGQNNDLIEGGNNNDWLYGDEGNDTIYGEHGIDEIEGGADNDELYGGIGGDGLWGEGGNDTLYGGSEDDDLHGGADNDTIYDGTGNDVVEGDGGDDIFYAQGGIDQFDGGTGNDTLSFKESASGITFNLQTSVHTGFAQTATVANIENFEFTNMADDITGDTQNNYFEGLDGNDTIDGGDGNDTLFGGDGNDTIITGEGYDTAYGGDGDDFIDAKTDLSTDQAVIYGGNGHDTIQGSKGSDSLYGENGNDNIVGSVGQDNIYGGNDNDTINGQGSDDSIYGGLGADIIDGGSGNDNVFGNENNDTLDGYTGTDLIYGGSGDDLINGGDDEDTLYGDQDNDVIYGGSESDTLYGNAGNDELHGEHGNEELYGGSGNDSLYGGLYADTLNGGADNDNLYGGHSNDVLKGDEGRDHLWGGDGNDQLTGGLGDDVFIFRANEGSDTVLDFSRSEGDKVLININTESNGDFSVSGNSSTTVFNLTWDGGSSTLTVHGMEYDPLNSAFDWGLTFD